MPPSFPSRYHGSYNQRIAVGSCISACGTYVYAGSEDGSVHVWECDTGKSVHVYSGFGLTAPVRGVVFHPHDHIAAFCSFGYGQPMVIMCAEPSQQLDRVATTVPRGSLWKSSASSASASVSGRLPPLQTLVEVGSPARPTIKRATLAAAQLPPPNLTVPTASFANLGSTPTSSMGTLPYRTVEPSEDDIVSQLQEDRKKQVDDLLANTRNRISHRREIFDASARVALPIGGGDNVGLRATSSPETLLGQRQSILTESSFASVELRALLTRGASNEPAKPQRYVPPTPTTQHSILRTCSPLRNISDGMP